VTTPTPATKKSTIETWGGRIQLVIETRGSGPPLVYLHPAGGLGWDPVLTELAQHYTIHAPILPGSNPDDSFAIHELRDVFDLTLAYEGALRAAGLEGAPVIGQSFGGMLAAELISSFPRFFSRAVLLDPAGLWNEAHPWNLDFMWAPPASLPALLFNRPDAPGARAMFAPPETSAEGIEMAVRAIWTFGCVAKFLWPVPDRGLSRRLHRVTCPTLVVWGEDDKLIPVAYASEYGRLIPHSRVEVLPDCGHIPQVEETAKTLALVRAFLDE
jgi:pimeloyl-ACP methyl ester carboxylesterase